MTDSIPRYQGVLLCGAAMLALACGDGANGSAGAAAASGVPAADASTGAGAHTGTGAATTGGGGANGGSGATGSGATTSGGGANGGSGATTSGGGANGGSGATGSGATGSAGDGAGPAPELKPKVALVTYLGGPGDQRIQDLVIGDDGSIVASGEGFTVHYDPTLSSGSVSGDANTSDSWNASQYADPTLYKEWNNKWDPQQHAKALEDPRTGLTYYMGTMQVSNDLQQPIFVACASGQPCDRRNETGNVEFLLWGWWASLCQDLSLMADSRGYDTWLMPGGRVGVLLHADGGNTTIARNPLRTQECSNAATCTDLNQKLEAMGVTAGTWQADADGPVALYMSIDPQQDGAPVKGTFLRGRATVFATDAWGRIYIPRTAEKRFSDAGPSNPFGHSDSASSGLFVLDTDFHTVLHARLGGTCEGAGHQKFGRVSLRDNLLVLGGTTCANDLKTTDNAVQSSSGGGQDAMLVVLRLW